ncbi:hypothetical protein F2P56_026943 [Juglans regia]|uniref:Uncharacterized protein n=1 Tax=Juglans regia TaxID=51240 RepID=A0A833WJ26_JUGRE|nr:hypothetical protein F2P56_026943 [Juglans regia]
MQLKEDLTLSTRDSRSVTESLHGVKMIADELAIIDHPVSDDDLTLYILNSLGPEFREIAAPIRTRETSMKFEEIHDLLVGHENYIRRLEAQSTTLIATANYTQRKGSSTGNDGSSSQRNSSHGHCGRGKRGPLDLGFKKYKPKCQLCDQMGHTAKTCFKFNSTEITANCATSFQGKNKKWLVDSTTSHNMTIDLSNLSIHSEYDGTDEVVIGDGSGLPVSHVGSVFCFT